MNIVTQIAAGLALGLGCLAAPAQTMLTIKSSDPSLDGRPVVLDGKFVGLVGDTIIMHREATQFGVLLAKGFYATMALHMKAGKLEVARPYGGECIGTTSWNIPEAKAPQVSGVRPHFTIQIPSIPVARGSSCSNEASELGCAQTYAEIHVSATPEVHAAIWISGKNSELATPKTVSYPFCVGMTPQMDIVLRKAGYTDCAVDIRVDGRTGEYHVDCDLQRVPR